MSLSSSLSEDHSSVLSNEEMNESASEEEPEVVEPEVAEKKESFIEKGKRQLSSLRLAANKAAGRKATNAEIARLNQLGDELHEDLLEGQELMDSKEKRGRSKDGIETKTNKQSESRGKARRGNTDDAKHYKGN